MKKILLISSWLILQTNTTLQAQLILENIDKNALNKNLLNNTEPDTEGSPYLFKDWALGYIIDNLGKKHENLQVRYSAFQDEVLILQSKGTIIVKKTMVNAFSLTHQHKTYHFRKFNLDDKPRFLEVVHQGEIAFLIAHRKDFKKAEPINGYGSSKAVKDVYTDDEDVYIQLPNDEIKEVKRNKKSFLSIFFDKQTDLENFIKKEKINFKANEDISKLCQYCESLL
jgi:hypothetical protein